MNAISIISIRKAISHFLGRFHVVIFVVIVLGGLSLAVLRLNNVLASSTDSGDYTPKSSNSEFDKATIDRIKKLKTRDEAGAGLDLSKGRTNPFVE